MSLGLVQTVAELHTTFAQGLLRHREEQQAQRSGIPTGVLTADGSQAVTTTLAEDIVVALGYLEERHLLRMDRVSPVLVQAARSDNNDRLPVFVMSTSLACERASHEWRRRRTPSSDSERESMNEKYNEEETSCKRGKCTDSDEHR